MTSNLNSRERRMWAHLALGRPLKVTAAELGIALSTTRHAKDGLCRKLGLASVDIPALVRMAATDRFFA